VNDALFCGFVDNRLSRLQFLQSSIFIVVTGSLAYALYDRTGTSLDGTITQSTNFILSCPF